jgi:hypothetical protein
MTNSSLKLSLNLSCLLTRGQAPSTTPRGKETRPTTFILRKRRNEVHFGTGALSCRILAYPFSTNSIPPTTLDKYEQLPPEEKERYAQCSRCGEIFDRRNLDEVLFHHTDHKHRLDIQYSGSEMLEL